jgi:hypothetical protein
MSVGPGFHTALSCQSVSSKFYRLIENPGSRVFKKAFTINISCNHFHAGCSVSSKTLILTNLRD